MDDDPAHDRHADAPAAEHGARAERDAVGERSEARHECEHARENRLPGLGAIEKIRAQPEHGKKAHRDCENFHAVLPEDRVCGVFLIEHHKPQTEEQHRQHAQRRAEATPAGELRHHGEDGCGQDPQQRRGLHQRALLLKEEIRRAERGERRHGDEDPASLAVRQGERVLRLFGRTVGFHAAGQPPKRRGDENEHRDKQRRDRRVERRQPGFSIENRLHL